MSISILDVPSDIMFKIFMMVSGDFHLHPFLNLRSNWCGNRISIRNRNEINSFISLFLYRGSRSLRYNSQSYSNYCMNNTLRMLPSNICILSRVCKNFKTELLTEPYWETLYIRDFRKGNASWRIINPCCFSNCFIALLISSRVSSWGISDIIVEKAPIV
mgnify:CR=1 FL=1